MMKKLLLATAASGLMFSTAVAQNPSAPANPPAGAPPAATQDKDASKPALNKDTSKPAAAQQQDSKPAAAAQQDSKPTAASPGQQVVTSQTPDQLLASKFNGTDVIGPDDKKVGDVSDVLFDKDGKVLAYVISIGGFLGIGSKDVAMAPNAFEIVKGKDGTPDKLKIAMSQEDLKQMASFEAYTPPRPATTGSAPTGSGPSRPSPASGANR